MKNFQAKCYLRNARRHTTADFTVQASRWPVAAYRAMREALSYAKASGLKRPKSVELTLVVLESQETQEGQNA